MPQEHDHLPSLRRAALASLGVGIVLLGAKWAAYWLTGSHAILSDALESIVNVVASALALVSVLLNARPPDPKYPYGYGKITFFSAGFEGGMIALAACAILYESVQGLMYGQDLRRLDHGLAIMAAAAVTNLALGLWLLRLARKADSLVLKADGKHVIADAFTGAGVVVGVGLVLLTGWSWLDGAVAILVGLNVLWTGYLLVREAFVGLMDRADPGTLARIVGALEAIRRPGWIDLHQLRCWQAGERTFVDFHLVVPDHWTVVDVHDAHVLCRETLRRTLGEATELIIHFDPDLRGPEASPQTGVWSVDSAVRVPAAGELGSEAITPASVDWLVT